LRVGAEAGPVFGFLKPYYIDYQTASSVNPIESVQYDADIHNRDFIIGEGDYFQGFNQLRGVPGLRLGLFTSANIAGSNLYVRSVVVSVHAVLFANRLEILDRGEDQFFFLRGHIGFLIGNAW